MIFTPEFGLFVHTYTPTAALWVFCLIVAAILLYFRKYHDSLTLLFAVTATTGLVLIMKFGFAIPRPEDALIELSSYAFPSGHAAAGMFIATICTWLLLKFTSKKSALLFLGITLLFLFGFILGLSRMLINVHTLPQVLAGFSIGIAVPLFIIFLRR